MWIEIKQRCQLTSRDLNSGDSLFCTTPPPPHHVKALPHLDTWFWHRNLHVPSLICGMNKYQFIALRRKLTKVVCNKSDAFYFNSIWIVDRISRISNHVAEDLACSGFPSFLLCYVQVNIFLIYSHWNTTLKYQFCVEIDAKASCI